VRVGGTAEPVLLNASAIGVARSAWSPDGKWIVCESVDGLLIVSPEGGQARAIDAANWLVYGWGPDGTTLFGLRGSDEDPNRYVFASLDIATGRSREIGRPIGTIPLANDPIRGFTFVPGEGFLTSIARVHSDLWMLEGF
jgi:hypothetical protein